MEHKAIKHCLVPGCKVTSRTHPSKRFITLPKDKERRKAWLRATKRDFRDLSEKTVLLICEDHFNLENDADNWIRLKYYNSTRIVLKPGVVPHIFECQPNRSAAQPSKRRLHLKKTGTSLLNLISTSTLPSASESSVSKKKIVLASMSSASCTIFGHHNNRSQASTLSKQTAGSLKHLSMPNKRLDNSSMQLQFTPQRIRPTPFICSPERQLAAEALCLVSDKHGRSCSIETQTCFKTENRAITAKPLMISKLVQCQLSPKPAVKHVATSFKRKLESKLIQSMAALQDRSESSSIESTSYNTQLKS